MLVAVSVIALGEATEGDGIVVDDVAGEDIQGAYDDGGEVLERFCFGAGHHGCVRGMYSLMRDGRMF